MEDKIILKFKTKNILNFYEIEPRSQILERPSIGEYWNILGVPVLPQGSQPIREIREIREKYFTFFQSGKSQGIW